MAQSKLAVPTALAKILACSAVQAGADEAGRPSRSGWRRTPCRHTTGLQVSCTAFQATRPLAAARKVQAGKPALFRQADVP